MTKPIAAVLTLLTLVACNDMQDPHEATIRVHFTGSFSEPCQDGSMRIITRDEWVAMDCMSTQESANGSWYETTIYVADSGGEFQATACLGQGLVPCKNFVAKGGEITVVDYDLHYAPAPVSPINYPAPLSPIHH